MPFRRTLTIAFAAGLLLAACGDDDDPVSTTDDPVVDDSGDQLSGDGAGGGAATCPVGTEDCDDTPDDAGPPMAGMCAAETPDCDDTVASPPADDVPADPDDSLSGEEEAELRAAARDLLGTPEDELADDVRVGRRGDEAYALTEDYVIGRMTVELDDDGSGTFVVTGVVLELDGGPETFTAEG